MSLIPFPDAASARLQRVTLRLSSANQVVLQSPWTHRRQVLERGFPAWEGEATIGRCTNADGDDETAAMVIAAFVNALEGVTNVFEMPHQRATIARNVTVSGSQVVDGRRVTNSANVRNAAVGMMVRNGDLTYSIREVLATGLVLDPQRPVTGRLMPSASIRVTARESGGVADQKSLDWAGPWTLQFREAVGG